MEAEPSAAREPSPWIARYTKAVLGLLVALAALGVYSGFGIPIAVFPTTNFPRVLIGVDNGVMPIDQMLVSITRPLEQAVGSVEGLTEVRSTTSRGTAQINLFFNWQVNMFQTLQRVESAIARVQPSLPGSARIEAHRLTFASFPILGFGLTSDTLPQTQLWDIATYQIMPRLSRVEGVASVIVQGGAVPEFHVVPDPVKLLRTGTTVTDILDAVQRTNLVESPGLIDRNKNLLLDLVDGQVHGKEQLAAVAIKTGKNGGVVHIGDIAAVTSSTRPLYTVVRANGKPAVLLNINRQPGTNTVAVSKEVYKEMADLRASLPPAIDFSVFYDQSQTIEEPSEACATPSSSALCSPRSCWSCSCMTGEARSWRAW